MTTVLLERWRLAIIREELLRWQIGSLAGRLAELREGPAGPQLPATAPVEPEGAEPVDTPPIDPDPSHP